MKFSAVLFDYGDTLSGKSGMPDDVKELIPKLFRCGYRLGVISNSHRYGDYFWLRKRLYECGIGQYLEVMIGSGGFMGSTSDPFLSSLGCHKHDPLIFKRALDYLNLRWKMLNSSGSLAGKSHLGWIIPFLKQIRKR